MRAPARVLAMTNQRLHCMSTFVSPATARRRVAQSLRRGRCPCDMGPCAPPVQEPVDLRCFLWRGFGYGAS
eukprot:7480021-Pyramimonas_sp.AAC.1